MTSSSASATDALFEDGDGDDPSNFGRDAWLRISWDLRGFWTGLRERLGCSETVAAVALCGYYEALSAGRWISYSRTPSHYERGASDSVLYTFKRVPGAVDWLDAAGLIEHFRQRPGVRGLQSRYRATAELVRIVGEVVRNGRRPLALRPKAPIILRDKAGESIPLPASLRSRSMLRDLEVLNEAHRAADLSCGPSFFRRIFNRTPERGGRFYVDGGAWQAMPKEARGRILIGGERCIELDLKCLHISMLYAEAGLPIPEDSYVVGNWPRPLVKLAMLVMVNAKSEKQAVVSLSKKPVLEELGMAVPGTSDAIEIAEAVIEAVKRRHAPIARTFGSDSGARLMRRDSEIANDVMQRMLKRGEIVLPVHDSYLSRRSAESSLEEVMREVLDLHGLSEIGIERSLPDEQGEAGPESGIPTDCGEKVYTYPPSPSSLLLPSPEEAQESDAAVRASAASEPHPEAAGRPPRPASSFFEPEPSVEARKTISRYDASEEPSSPETPTGSLDVASCRHSPIHATSHSMSWDRSSILASLDIRRHDRAVAAARAVAGPAVSPSIDWSPNLGIGLAQHTDRGATWTWSLPGRRECVVHLVNAAAETVLAVADQAAAGRVVETYLRTLAGDGPRLRVDVSYAGRYDLSLTPEENVVRFEPVSDVLRRPSLVPGLPDNDDEEPPFSTDPAWFDDEEDLPLAA